MNHYILDEILQKIGLSKTESDIYLVLLKSTEMSVNAIARKVDMPRTTVYGHINKMIEKGFIYQIKKTIGSVFASIPPDDIIRLLQQQKMNLNKNIDTVKSHLFEFNAFVSKSLDTPKVKYYEGEEGLGAIYEKIKNTKNLYGYFNAAVVDPNYTKIVGQISRDYNILFKEIVIDNKEGREYKKNNQSDTHLIKLLGNDKIFHSDNIILDDRIFHIAYGERIIALEIVNPILVHTQIVMFNLAWDAIL